MRFEGVKNPRTVIEIAVTDVPVLGHLAPSNPRLLSIVTEKWLDICTFVWDRRYFNNAVFTQSGYGLSLICVASYNTKILFNLAWFKNDDEHNA